MMPKWCHDASCLWTSKEDSFFFRAYLSCIELRHGCVVKNIVFLGENAHLSEMPRCLVAPMLSLLLSRIDADLEAFWNSKVASKRHLQAIGNGMVRSCLLYTSPSPRD